MDTGRRREVSTRTRKYAEARRIKAAAMREQQEGSLPRRELVRLPFERVVEFYLESAAIRLKASSLKKERYFLVRPIVLLGDVKCDQITANQIRRLQTGMKRDGCKSSYINLVTGAVTRVLRFVKVWNRIGSDVKRLREPKVPIARVLTVEEKTRLFQIATERPQWLVAYAAALIAVSTTMRGADLRSLQWKNVDLADEVVDVPVSKTAAGVRRIPLNGDAVHGFRLLRDRAMSLGVFNPDYFVFLSCQNGHLDPSKPQKTWRTSWRSLTTAAGLKGLRFHDLRHHCITEFAENNVPEQAILAIAGHVSRRMLDHYCHIRSEAKRKAVDSLPSVIGQRLDAKTARAS